MTYEQALEYADSLLTVTRRCRFLGDYFGYPDYCITHFIENCGTPYWFESLSYYDPD